MDSKVSIVRDHSIPAKHQSEVEVTTAGLH